MGRVGRWIGLTLLALGVVLVLAAAAHLVSPWPGVLVIRAIFDRGAAAASAALAPHVPPGVQAETGIPGPGGDPDTAFDLYRPEGAAGPLPVIFWTHGGAFVSGRPGDIGNYLKILAAQGYVVVAPGYTLAPAARFPTPVAEVAATIARVLAQADRYGIDPSRVVLAGDSAGAQVAAQIATIVTTPGESGALGIVPPVSPAQLRGAILFCGPYDLALMRGEGLAGVFLGTVARAYAGTRNWHGDASFARFTLTDKVTSGFPPVFLSAGNRDPLLPHSLALQAALASQGVPVDALFFPADRDPPLAHEYQFGLDDPAGTEALERVLAFLARVTAG